MLRVHQKHLESALLQHVVQGHPIYAGRLHGDGFDTALLQPIGQPVQVGCEGLETSYGLSLGIQMRGDGHVMLFGPDVNPGGSRVYHLQSQLPILLPHFPPFLLLLS